ncbi:hypothetical protein [Legionella sainthelensi]|uniref:hypothetical protein n=1 Tax=Legionella sainthelensi TaxID=28087 RepID=UPI001FD11C64|nr:hypothetical protein [Legionella sainthelensi]
MQKKVLLISLGLMFISMIVVSVPLYITFYLPLPILNTISFNIFMMYGAFFCRVVTAIIIYLLSKKYWSSFKLSERTFLFALLIMELAEGIFQKGFLKYSLTYFNIFTLYLSYLSLSYIICCYIHRASEYKWRLVHYLGWAIVATISFNLIRMGILMGGVGIYTKESASALFLSNFLTCFELTVASFITFFLLDSSGKLPSSTLLKGLILTGLISFLRVDIPLRDIHNSEGNYLYRVFYYGQSLWEYFLLGILIAYFLKRSKLK